MANDALDRIFGALADPTRRAILLRLRSGDAGLTELARSFSISLPAVGRHLNVLEAAGLISRARIAQRRPCRLEDGALVVAGDWLDELRGAVQKMPARSGD
nr:metalloregulator ArsR/SmtB family transcription factor [Actinoplanes ovalisporus]